MLPDFAFTCPRTSARRIHANRVRVQSMTEDANEDRCEDEYEYEYEYGGGGDRTVIYGWILPSDREASFGNAAIFLASQRLSATDRMGLANR
jgi:hypothetical protein